MIRFLDITKDNFYKVLKLTVTKDQESYVSANVKSLAECYLYRDANDVFPYAIEYNKEIVGFILTDLDVEEKEFLIWRIMIDQNYQNQGIGKKAILKAIELARKSRKYDRVVADYVIGNDHMERLLKSLGFIEVDKDLDNNEVVMSYDLLND